MHDAGDDDVDDEFDDVAFISLISQPPLRSNPRRGQAWHDAVREVLPVDDCAASVVALGKRFQRLNDAPELCPCL